MTNIGNSSTPAAKRAADTSPLLQSARFFTTAAQFDQLPASDWPEVAFVGRSNAGKSTAINVLCGQRRLAFSSKTPGRTQHINLFSVGLGGTTTGLLADLPGYGYASVPLATKQRWERFIAQYLTQRTQLVGLILIADSRHGLTPLDWTLLSYSAPAALPVHVLLTKADKLTRSQQHAQAQAVRDDLQRNGARAGLMAPTSVQMFSATKRQGLREASQLLEEWLQVPGHGADDPVASASPGAPQAPQE
ncbi:MAG: YihA family ribosome biogenesis GTP-binding protein [Betaproteobacteria bacterium]|nr:YihA family ribosome biogenesis GTP-binding protein [Betaproteobacteria bacterium]